MDKSGNRLYNMPNFAAGLCAFLARLALQAGEKATSKACTACATIAEAPHRFGLLHNGALLRYARFQGCQILWAELRDPRLRFYVSQQRGDLNGA